MRKSVVTQPLALQIAPCFIQYIFQINLHVKQFQFLKKKIVNWFKEIHKKQPFEAMAQQSMSQHQPNKQLSDESCSGTDDPMVAIEREKLYYLERILREQEKTNMRLHSICENQKQEVRNHDRMIDLLYRIAFNK